MPKRLQDFGIAIVLFTAVYLLLQPLVSFNDAHTYHEAATLITSGKSPQVYRMREAFNGSQKFMAFMALEPPYALTFTAPLALFDLQVSRRVLDGFLIVILAAFATLLASVLKLSKRQTIIFLLCCAASGGVFESLKVSKPIPIFALGFTLALFFLGRGREYIAGVASVMCLIKPHYILPFAAFAFGCKKWKYLVGLAVATALLLAITFPFHGAESYAAYARAISYVNEHPITTVGADAMPTIRALLLRGGIDPLLSSRIATIIFGCSLLLMVGLGWRTRNTPTWWIPGTMCGLTVAAATAIYMHNYDFVILIPVVTILILELIRIKNWPDLILTTLAVAMFMTPLYQYIFYYYLIQGRALINLHLIGTLFLAFVGCRAAFRWREPVENGRTGASDSERPG